MVHINSFHREVECIYNDEKYSVRNNGAVLRHSRDNKRPRPTDNEWTFGKPNDRTGYMEIASVRIHRIVATAFHGKPPTKEHVVDHIDTNKQNNRPENLRWVTRLENVLLNPITAKRITLVCGSIEKFPESNYEWMCTVSAEEAQVSQQRMQAWAESDKQPSGDSLGKWIFLRDTVQNYPTVIIPEEQKVMMSLTPGAGQRNWRTPSEFPCTPQEIEGNPLISYAVNLTKGTILSRNNYYSSLVINSGFSEDHQALYVMTESLQEEGVVKRYALTRITYENGLFVHTGRTFFSREGAEKQFTLAQGLKWTGGDSIDDYC